MRVFGPCLPRFNVHPKRRALSGHSSTRPRAPGQSSASIAFHPQRLGELRAERYKGTEWISIELESPLLLADDAMPLRMSRRSESLTTKRRLTGHRLVEQPTTGVHVGACFDVGTSVGLLGARALERADAR